MEQTIENKKFERGVKAWSRRARRAPKTNRLHLKHDKCFKLLLSIEQNISDNAVNKQEINWKIGGSAGNKSRLRNLLE